MRQRFSYFFGTMFYDDVLVCPPGNAGVPTVMKQIVDNLTADFVSFISAMGRDR
jgi:hypothetical protein